MDVLCVSKNGIHQLAAELRPSAGVALSLNWFGDAYNGLAISVTRSDEIARLVRWTDMQVFTGDKFSFVTQDAERCDEPIDSCTTEDMLNLARVKRMMQPGNKVKILRQEIAMLDFSINNKILFSFLLTTDNMLSVQFVWLGDRSGASMLHISLDPSQTLLIPKIAFGDELTVELRSSNHGQSPVRDNSLSRSSLTMS